MAKKGVSKEDLKHLMKKMKSQGTINHPLAKYNSLGHLVCTVCNCQVKSDRLWNAHLLSRSHKENVAQPSSRQADMSMLSNKRKTDSEESLSNAKRLKDADNGREQKPKGILKNHLPLSYPSSDEESLNGAGDSTTNVNPQGLPSDFFDGTPSTTNAVADTDVEKMDTKPTDELPEGFFDDPVADAKARNIEYVDKGEVEWNKFQTELKQETQISEQIEAEDDFAITEERHILEIDEQLVKWKRVNDILEKKAELMKQKMDTDIEQRDSSSDTDDLEFEQFLNWRSKKVIK